MAPLTEENTIP